MKLIDQPLPGLERAAEVRQIERDFPGWHVWISSAGRWWATRRGSDARWGHDTPPMTVDADDANGLRAELANWPARGRRNKASADSANGPVRGLEQEDGTIQHA